MKHSPPELICAAVGFTLKDVTSPSIHIGSRLEAEYYIDQCESLSINPFFNLSLSYSGKLRQFIPDNESRQLFPSWLSPEAAQKCLELAFKGGRPNSVSVGMSWAEYDKALIGYRLQREFPKNYARPKGYKVSTISMTTLYTGDATRQRLAMDYGVKGDGEHYTLQIVDEEEADKTLIVDDSTNLARWFKKLSEPELPS